MADPLVLTAPRSVTLTSPDLQDGVAWWRMTGPWNALREEIPQLSLLTLDLKNTPPHWTPIGLSRVMIINRPYQSGHLAMVDTAGASGVPAIVDFDDCLWEVPRFNQAHGTYDHAARSTAQIAATRAYTVTVTTPRLREYILSKVAPDADVRVIPNAIPDWYTWPSVARRKVIIYRGGSSHMGDLLDHREAIAEVLRARPDWHLITIGEDPWWLHEILPEGSSTHVPRQPLPVLHRWLRHSAAAVMIVPLRDCELNRCKSNISWIEGTLAGAAVLARGDLPEFNRPGVDHYNGSDFGDQLATLLDAPQSYRDGLVAQSQAFIDANLRYRHVNPLRAEILRECIDD